MAALIVLAGFIYALFLVFRHFWRWETLPRTLPARPFIANDGLISDPEMCRQLIAGELTQGPRHNQLTFLSSRAIPSQRLRTAFPIENAFTSSDPQVAADFVREASKRINLKPAEWFKLSGSLVDTVRQWIFLGFDVSPTGSGSKRLTPSGNCGSVQVNITNLVQALTLKAVLMTVCKADACDNAGDLAVLELAQQINRGWIESKKRTPASTSGTDMVDIEYEQTLWESVHAVFSQSGKGGQNPLNFVIPSFETMWRVVLRCLLEVKFQSGREHPEWSEALIAYNRNPTKKQFESSPSLQEPATTTAINFNKHQNQVRITDTPSAKDIVMEALRLYPPTRRIRRAYQWDNSAEPFNPIQSHGTKVPSQASSNYEISRPSHKTIAADIEECHLRSDIWGTNAASFYPARWLDQTLEQKRAFMPFGSQPCECPAKAVFGPRMVGVLVGALLLVLANEEEKLGVKWKLDSADERVMKSLAQKERLSLERDAYDDLELLGSWGRRRAPRSS